MYKTFAPKMNGRYLSSNVNITVFDKHGKNVSVPVGGKYTARAFSCFEVAHAFLERYVKFKTRKFVHLKVMFRVCVKSFAAEVARSRLSASCSTSLATT